MPYSNITVPAESREKSISLQPGEATHLAGAGKGCLRWVGRYKVAIPSFTFPVVVPVHVEGVEQLVVVVSHQIHSPSMGLDDPNDLQHMDAPVGP